MVYIWKWKWKELPLSDKFFNNIPIKSTFAMFLLLYTRKIEHIMLYVEIIFIFHFCQTSNIYISIKQYLLKFVVPCRTFAINDSPPTNKIWAAFAESFQVMSCVLNSVSVSRLQIFLGFPYLFIALWVPG